MPTIKMSAEWVVFIHECWWAAAGTYSASLLRAASEFPDEDPKLYMAVFVSEIANGIVNCEFAAAVRIGLIAKQPDCETQGIGNGSCIARRA